MMVPERVLVVGLGVSGLAAAEALLDEGVAVRVVDEGKSPVLDERAKTLRRKGAEVSLRASRIDEAWPLLVVASPGVPPSSPLLSSALEAKLKVVSEVELAWQMNRDAKRILGVTGTNGKTTTTSLLARMMSAAAAGNIGHPLVTAVRSEPGSVVVAELSSAQLAFIDELRVGSAIFLNLADDHYDWHSDRRDYLAAKARITENQTEDDLFVFRAEDPACREVAGSSDANLAAFGLQPALTVRDLSEEPVALVGALEAGSLIAVSDGETHPLVALEDIRLEGRHNLENVLAAALVAFHEGVDVQAIREAVRDFEPLPHRITVVDEKHGITYINDSKATNPHATLTAMEGRERVVLIAGGQDRGLDLSPLATLKPQLLGVVVMGETSNELEGIFAGLPVHRVADVEEAVLAAESMASHGDTVLLSPACPSWDQYSSYVERGERFAEAVRLL